jgi:uncharacterized protein (DUF885 family)
MKKFITLLSVAACLFTFMSATAQGQNPSKNSFAVFLDQYYKERIQLLPLEGTYFGTSDNNDKLFADFTDSYRLKLRNFFSLSLADLQKFNRKNLSKNEQLSYDILKKELSVTIEGIDVGYFEGNYPMYKYFPFTQFSSIPNLVAEWGSGNSSQPFNTEKDYGDWVKRANAFAVWADSAILYFRKGVEKGIVMPEALILKIIPQMEALVNSDPEQTIFYGPVTRIPAEFSAASKQKLTAEYIKLINEVLVPTYRKLGNYLKTEYLVKAKKYTGISELPEGDKQYRWLIRYWTTTDKSPDEIYKIGLAEVKRITLLMDSVRIAVGFKGDLPAFYTFMKTDRQFMPFKTPEEVLNAFRAVEARISPNLMRMFNKVPRTKFEVRQVEAFREASSSASYSSGLPDGTRPGIFYVPIIDATQFNVTTGVEGLFLHEAIPGHHYQIALQSENEDLPMFRRYFGPAAYVEGWALYTEALGKDLGIYTDPYQYVGSLTKEIHRAIRLVVDAGMHSKNLTREQAIKYMMDNMPLNERGVTAEIERYMAIPAQALSYKIGSMKIQQLRQKYQRQLGSSFSLAEFHDQVLGDGPMALETLEKKMDEWAAGKK